MTDFETKLLNSGWKRSPNSIRSATLYWKGIREDGDQNVCLCNNKLSVFVYIYELPFQPVVNIEIVGEYAKGRWTNLSLYNHSIDDVTSNLDQYVQNLLKSWDALCDSSRIT